MKTLPRVERVVVRGSSTLRIKWRGGGNDDVDLTGWIATGGDILVPLKNPDLFGRAKVADFGAAVAWDEFDLRIDAVHLKQIVLKDEKHGAG